MTDKITHKQAVPLVASFPARSFQQYSLIWLVMIVLLILVNAAVSRAESPIDWASLGLSSNQSQQVHQLETEWANTYRRIYPQVERDRATLRDLLSDPNASEGQVMIIQSRLQKNEDLLRHEATRIHLKKKQLLNAEQRQHLMKMMTD